MTAPEYTPDVRLTELLEAWQKDICSVPVPRLIDLAVAVAIVRDGLNRTGTAPDAVPVRNSGQPSSSAEV